MALFTRIGVLHKCLVFNLVPKSRFHSLTRLKRVPPSGSRSFFLKKPTQNDLKKADDIPDGFLIIYRNTMSRYILGAQIASIVTGGMVLMGFFLKTEYQTNRRESLKWSSTSRATNHEEYYYLTGFILILVLVQVIISQTPVRIYKVPGTSKYIGINYGHYIFGKEKYNFNRGEISPLKESGILPWKANRYTIETQTDRRTVILLDYFFRRPADLSIMLGEQKDPDLEVE